MTEYIIVYFMIRKIINKLKQTGPLSLIIAILKYPLGKRRKIYKKMLKNLK